jgi:pectin methylesterase-like acyl-CoA thioesterase
MDKKLIPVIILAVILLNLFTLAVNVHPAEARAIIVPNDYPTIQQAVDAAYNGDTIHVRAGTYTENVLIYNKSISLLGDGVSNTTIRGIYKGG